MQVVNFTTKEEVDEFDDWETLDQLMFHTPEAVAALLGCNEIDAQTALDLVESNNVAPTDSALEFYYYRFVDK